MVKKLIICVGSSGTGKTTYAKKLQREGFKFIDFDNNCNYAVKDKTNPEGFINYKNIEEEIESSDGEDCVLDGYTIGYDYGLESMKKFVGDMDLEIHQMVCSPRVIFKRQLRSKVKVHPMRQMSSQCINLTKKLEGSGAIIKRIKTELDFEEISFEEALKTFFMEDKSKDISKFLEDLGNLSHDKNYQDIEVEGEQIFEGYSNSKLTWNRLRRLVDWDGKTVCDLGCFHGYFSIKAAELGAKCLGIDRSDYVLDIARRVATLNGLNCEFKIHDMQEPFSHKSEVYLVLNMLHHVKKPEVALESIFSNCDEAIFEINLPQKEQIDEFAGVHGFSLVKTLSSHRSKRVILLYRRK